MGIYKDEFSYVNERYEYNKMANYIMQKQPNVFTIEEAKDFAKFLTKVRKFTPEDIYNGKADKEINNNAALVNIKNASVYNQNEEIIDIPLKVKKEIGHAVVIQRLKQLVIIMGSTFLVFAAAKGIVDLVNENNYEEEIPTYLGALATIDNNRNEGTILNQNSYQVGTDQNGYPKFAYNPDGIAKDILLVSSKDPQLFDLCMLDVYYDMDYDRLSNMDTVLSYLQIRMENNPEFASLYYKVEDCKFFLDYIMKSNFANVGLNPDYLKVVEAYKTKGSFQNLSSQDQKVIEELMSSIEEVKLKLGKNLKEEIETLVQERDASRELSQGGRH